MPAFQVGAICYPDAASALDAWKGHFPSQPDSNGVVWYVGPASINTTTGVITGTLRKSTSTAGTASIAGITLPACNASAAASVFDKMPLNDMIFPIAMVVALIFGFGQGRAH